MEPIVKRRIESFKDAKSRIGATYVPDEGTFLRVWSPQKDKISIRWDSGEEDILTRDKDGYFSGHFPDKGPGDKYYLVVDGKTVPDPASRFQPDGPTGMTEIVGHEYPWTDHNWRGVPYEQWVIYEIHTGTFSDRHDFQGIIDDLPRLKDLGVTALEIMPVSQFSGARNWGYDGVFPHAVQNSYGGPSGLKALVDACHAHGMAIILDVVYNHLGPEGNVLPMLGSYFQTKYKTPWGDAINFDGPYSEDVRKYFLQSVWQWLTEYHFDGLRLDAIHTIFDTSPISFLEELTRVKKFAEIERGFPLVVIGETDMNDSRLLAPTDQNGIGLDAHWADDLHHCLHVMLTGETHLYYADYAGGLEQLARTYRAGVSFEGEYSFARGRCHGRSYSGIDKKRLIAETQNHDQIGNRVSGERINTRIDFEKVKLMAAAIFLSPFTPMFFMGEEIAAEQPFHYFVSHESEELNGLVRKGRNEEFALSEETIDPASEDLFQQSVLSDKTPSSPRAKTMYGYFKDLIAYSKKLRSFDHHVLHDEVEQQIILVYRKKDEEMRVVLSFSDKPGRYAVRENDRWSIALRSSAYKEGTGVQKAETIAGSTQIEPFSAILLIKENPG